MLTEIRRRFTLYDTKTLVARLPWPGQEIIATKDVENVEHILKNNFKNYPKGQVFRDCFEEVFAV